LAVLTGAQLITDEVGLKPEAILPEHLGTCKKISVTKDDTIILDGGGSKKELEERCELIRQSAAASTSDYEKEKLNERLAKLVGGVAVVKVGGASEVEVSEKKDRVVDALNATRAAVEEGIVAGGGLALLYATPLLSTVKYENQDQKVGINIVRKALAVPARAIIDNSGMDGAVITGKLLEEAKGNAFCTRGINAANGEMVDMIAAGIIDPTKVVRSALVDAAGVASLMATTEATISDAPEKKSKGGNHQNHDHDDDADY